MARASIVILTGAGISQESGLSTFRDKDGIWSKVRIEDVATPEAFARDPDRVDAFYNARRRGYLAGDIKPNAAHEALARLERNHDGDVLIVTQNIDNLHEAVGSKNVLHMHGELMKVRCLACKAIIEWTGDVTRQTQCPDCTARALRPHVVWFGEMCFIWKKSNRPFRVAAPSFPSAPPATFTRPPVLLRSPAATRPAGPLKSIWSHHKVRPTFRKADTDRQRARCQTW